MDNQSRTKNIFSDSECLSQEAMFNYHHGKLTAKEKHFVERHILDCELCADALAGFTLIKNTFVIDEVKKEVASLTEAKVISIFSRRFMLAAASVALLICSSLLFFYYSKDKEEVAVGSMQLAETKKEETVSSEQLAVKKEEVTAVDNKQLAMKEEKAVVNSKQLEVKRETRNKKQEVNAEMADVVASEETNSSELSDYSITPESNQAGVVSKNEDIAVKSPNSSTNSMYSSPATARSMAIVDKSNTAQDSITYIEGLKTIDYTSAYNTPSKNKLESGAPAEYENVSKMKKDGAPSKSSIQAINYNDILEKGLTKYKLGNYEGAIEDLNTILSQFPNDLNAIFYTALAYYNLDKSELALKNLDKVLTDVNKTFYDEAKWYKVLTLIKQGRTQRAKEILNEIIAAKGFYKDKAVDKLKEVK